MVEAARNGKMNAMQSVPVAQVPATPPGDFIGGQGQYLDTANPVSPGAVLPESGTTIDSFDPTEPPLIFEVTSRQVQVINTPEVNINSDCTYLFYEVKVRLRHDNVYADRLFDQADGDDVYIKLLASPFVRVVRKLPNWQLLDVELWGVRKSEGLTYLSDADGLEISYPNQFNRTNIGGGRTSRNVPGSSHGSFN